MMGIKMMFFDFLKLLMFLSSLCMSSAFKVHISLPCRIIAYMHASHRLPFTQREKILAAKGIEVL